MSRQEEPGRSARLLFMVTALFWSAQYNYTQFINPELSRMGMNAAFMGLVSGAYGFTQMVLRIPLGILADRAGRQKPFVVAGSLLTMLAGLGFVLFYTPGGFLLSRGLAGVASASWVSFTVLYSSYFAHSEGPRRISHLNTANMGGRLAGFFLIILIVPLMGLVASFWFSALCGGIGLVMSLGLKERPHERQGISWQVLLQVSRDRYLLACSIMGILTQVLAFSTYTGFTVNAAKALGAQDAGLTWLNIALLVPTLVMNLLVTTRLLRITSGRALVIAGFVVAAFYCLLVPLATSLWQLYLIQILGGFASSLTFAVLIGQSVRDIPQHLRAVAMGVYQAVYGIGMTLGPILMGLMIDNAGMKTAFFVMAGVSLLSAALAYPLLGAPPRAMEEPPQAIEQPPPAVV